MLWSLCRFVLLYPQLLLGTQSKNMMNDQFLVHLSRSACCGSAVCKCIVCDPRSQTVKIMCGRSTRAQRHRLTCQTSLHHGGNKRANANFRLRCSSYGSGLEHQLGLAQCYDDLSLLDCEYTGRNDRTVCGNKTERVQHSRHRPDGLYCKQFQQRWAVTAMDGLRCLPWSEGRGLNTGCFLRYSDTNFLLNPVPEMEVQEVKYTFLVSVHPLFSLIFYLIKKSHFCRDCNSYCSGDAEKFVKTLSDSSLNFKYSTLEKATGSFNEANKLGQGGFGTVYKGVLADGREIAVKRLFFNNKHRASDFYNEVKIISSLNHKNLVRLLGCSCSGPESLLVYEFLVNKSLDCFIFDSRKNKELNWEKRFQIIIGTAEGLMYLHENPNTRIIHRDIKASNILLDSRLRAKIADFGLARSFQEDKSHISTAIAGTLGYMAPEYLAHGQLTEKADVYSFGVLLLEIVTGRQNNRSKPRSTQKAWQLL
ncbi:UNVERIFIED_CONTAM: Cysteine-rich receptor-like protein kinase [Sesamum angustifolium]|uniref:Cysteine-rich receptor-like protein kinase n=1 Tax=Sesamum angustifolium TaxID=2727405 RepID=A0AAW2Q8V2_9LAMI